MVLEHSSQTFKCDIKDDFKVCAPTSEIKLGRALLKLLMDSLNPACSKLVTVSVVLPDLSKGIQG